MAEGKFIHANGLDIFYQVEGQGKPLILLHGATDTHALWKPFIPEFSKFYRVITPDSRGHGRTMNPDDGLSYQVMADDLAALIQELDIEKPLIFGYSDGGQIALELGMRYPNLVGAFVIGGAWFQFSDDYQKGLSGAGFVAPGEIDFDIYEQFAPADWRKRMSKFHLNPDPNYPEILLRHLASLFWTPLNYEREDFLKIQAPTLIIVGEQDEMVPPEESREMAEMIPGAEFALIPDTTHTQVIVPGGECLPIVIDFLSRQVE